MTFIIIFISIFAAMKRQFLYLFFLLCSCLPSLAVTQQEAKAYISNGQYAQAVAAYRVLMQQPLLAKNPECNKLFGQALCMTGAYAESVSYLEMAAQKKKTGAWWYLGISRQHLYDFEGAIDALEKYKSSLPKNSAWIERTDSVLAECQIGLKGVSHVQDVVIIDSMMVNKEIFFSHYKLGNESGRVLRPSQCGEPFVSRADSVDASIFENQAADYRLMVCKSQGEYRLYESHLFGGEWSELQMITSIEKEGSRICYPFLRSDSETLFFASDETPGFGGLDIYKTHYNSENESYYSPERMPMPFNSPYDDYMMAVDESYLVGWFATNRNADEGQVCIYLFQIEESPRYLEGQQPGRAQISAIADTWRKKEGYEALVEEIMNAPQFVEEKEEIRIPISDAIVYASADQFRNPKAREMYESSLRLESDLLDVQGELDSMRQEYHVANAKRKQELRKLILASEQKEQQLIDQLKACQKKYRNLELQ